MTKKQRPGLPIREQILDFISTSDQPAGKREIARAFGLSGADKMALKTLLRDMADEGLIDSAPGRVFACSSGREEAGRWASATASSPAPSKEGRAMPPTR